MMASNLASAEGGGHLEQPQNDSWWIHKWASTLATIGAVALGFMGVLAIAFNVFTPIVMFAGALYVGAAALILAIEGSSIVSFLKFAKPVGVYFETKGLYVRTGVYALLAVVPFVIGAGIPITFGFIIACSITSLYGMIIIGKKGSLEDMKAAVEQPRI